AELLQAAYRRVLGAGLRIVNLDCVVAAERPKLSPYKHVIVDRIAGILEIGVDQVNLKAKTGEGVGAVGAGEVIEARCVALLENFSSRPVAASTPHVVDNR
ncbi:MAG: 2-C-methyl-D-erythritol 2,4-cyclodiphosphate synthase, partial [Planctomycetota bacterium]